MMENLDYGVIGNGKTAALVSKEGSMDWLCFPDFDSPSIFSSILDQEKGGSFGFRVNGNYTATQRYLADTNILSTLFTSAEGSFEVIDFMPRYRTGVNQYYTPAEIYRYIVPLGGTPRFSIVYEPVMNYAREQVKHSIYNSYIRSHSSVNPGENIYLYTDFDFDDVLHGNEITLGKESFLMLSYHQKLVHVEINRVYLEYERTKVYWMNWSSRSERHLELNEVIGRSLLTLKMLSFEQTGAVLAAITTGIPETIGQGRNWDYRFCWLRDASMSIDVLQRLGHKGAAERYLNFIKSILSGQSDRFQIMYGIRGERELTEKELGHLAGYCDSRPVRIGNAAYGQRQNDVYGYLMHVIHNYFMRFKIPLAEAEQLWQVVKNIAYTVKEVWHRPDHSIWEFRDREDHYVSSKVMCWVALDRAVLVAEYLGKTAYCDKWRGQADRIREQVIKKGWDEKQSAFTQCYGCGDLDASVLLMEYYGFIPAGDSRFVSTVEAVKRELYHQGLVFRYRNMDDFGVPQSAFLICTFWLIRALFKTGNPESAREIFDRVASYCNHLGLFSEDLDFETKRMLGNFPQAYSHLALIETALLFTDKHQECHNLDAHY